ncbi:hypothetical protein ACFLSF_02590 [Candidatus Bipolaricaulota bacterium]
MAAARRPGKTHRLLRESLIARLRKRPALLVVGGLALGAVAVGICLLLLHFVIEPFSRPETRGYTTFRGEHFKLWYNDESEHKGQWAEMEAALETEYVELLALMGIPEDAFDGDMDVFVHDSIPQMQTSIMRRKASTAGAVFHYPFDVLVAESPRPALIEVLLHYGWGGCFSPALYAGTLEYLTDPEISYLSIVKAAPSEMAHPLNDLLALELRGGFPATMYRQLTGPTAPTAIVDFQTIRIFFAIPNSLADAQVDRFPVLEMAALVEFLVEQRGGMQQFAQAWGPGLLDGVLQRVDAAMSMDELDALWQASINTTGDVASVSPLWRVEFLLEGGFSEDAFELIKTWDPNAETHTPEECAAAARCALSVGAFDEAARWAEALDESIRGEYEQLLQLFAGWERRETGELVLLAPAPLVDAAFERVEAGYGAICDRIGTSLKEGSGVRPIFFVYRDEASCAMGAQLAPANPAALSAAHVVLDDNMAYAIVDLLLPRLWNWRPISPLVRLGTVAALVFPREELLAWGTELACTGDWRSISSLSISSASEHLLRAEVGLLIAEVESMGGIEAVHAAWVAGQEHGRVSLETTLQSVVGSTTREMERRILFDVIDCNN